MTRGSGTRYHGALVRKKSWWFVKFLTTWNCEISHNRICAIPGRFLLKPIQMAMRMNWTHLVLLVLL